MIMEEAMKKVAQKIYLIINMWRIIPVWLLIAVSKNKEIIKQEIDRWCSYYYPNYNNGIFKVASLLLRYKEYRNVLLYRFQRESWIKAFVLKRLFPPLDSLYINTEIIGEKFFIHHGFSTIINAESIGDNCWINQQVTIGMKNGMKPTIGSNVKICAGSIIVGGVTIGDNCIVGAGSVVVKSIPNNEVWAGNPAHFIKMNIS